MQDNIEDVLLRVKQFTDLRLLRLIALHYLAVFLYLFLKSLDIIHLVFFLFNLRDHGSYHSLPLEHVFHPSQHRLFLFLLSRPKRCFSLMITSILLIRHADVESTTSLISNLYSHVLPVSCLSLFLYLLAHDNFYPLLPSMLYTNFILIVRRVGAPPLTFLFYLEKTPIYAVESVIAHFLLGEVDFGVLV